MTIKKTCDAVLAAWEKAKASRMIDSDEMKAFECIAANSAEKMARALLVLEGAMEKIQRKCVNSPSVFFPFAESICKETRAAIDKANAMLEGK